MLIIVLQQIPKVSPTGRYTTALPLLFILCLSALKEIVEDVVRISAWNTVLLKRRIKILSRNHVILLTAAVAEWLERRTL